MTSGICDTVKIDQGVILGEETTPSSVVWEPPKYHRVLLATAPVRNTQYNQNWMKVWMLLTLPTSQTLRCRSSHQEGTPSEKSLKNHFSQALLNFS